MGHLRYGHYEGVLHLDEENYNLFIKDPLQYIKDFNYQYDLNFIVDDYEIESIGDLENVDWKEID